MPGAFDEIRFPDKISYGSKGGPGFNTNIIETDSGAEQRIARWSLPRHSYDISYGIKSYADLTEVKHFYIARLGPAVGFRFKDWRDFTTNPDGQTGSTALDEFLVPIDGTDRQFQLVKRYTSGSVSRARVLTKIVTDRIHIAVDGEATGAGWHINYNSGIITFDDPPAVTPTGGCEFDVPVRFGLEIDKRLSISTDDFSNGSLDSMPLIEIKDAGGGYAEIDNGGAVEYCLTGNKSLTTSDKRVQLVQPTADGSALLLPPEEDVPYGGPIFFIVNTSGTFSMDVEYDDGSLFVTLPARNAVTMLMGPGNGDPTWYGI